MNASRDQSGTLVPINHQVNLPAPATPPQAVQVYSPEHAMQLLQHGSGEERIAARRFLASVFEQRGMLDEVVELLETSAQEGDTDPQTFVRLSGLYRQSGRGEDAEAATTHATMLLSRQAPIVPQQAPVHQPAAYQPALGYQQQPVHITVSPQITNHTVIGVGKQGPPTIVRLLYFLVIGWWFGLLWLACALLLFLPVITIPLAVLMLAKLPKAFFL